MGFMKYVIFQVKPLLSVDNREARLRVLSLYKAWCRQIPFMVSEFDIPVNEAQAKAKLRERFTANANVKDLRVIDMLVIKVKIYYKYYFIIYCHKSFCFFRDNKIYKKWLKNGPAQCTSCPNTLRNLSKKDLKISCPSS